MLRDEINLQIGLQVTPHRVRASLVSHMEFMHMHTESV